MGNPATLLSWLGSPIGVAMLVIATLLLIVRKRQQRLLALPATATKIGRTLARKTSAMRVALVLILLIGYIATAISLPRDTVASNSRESLPSASSGILVVDVSGSIGEENKEKIIEIFEEAIERRLHLGLVIFSGEGYLAWGPNVPAEESLAQMKRFFALNTKDDRGRDISVVPWTLGGGTEIYEGMLDALAAREILARRGFPNTPIVLISDLQDGGDSKAKTIELVAKLKSEGSPVWIIQMGRTTNSNTSARYLLLRSPYVSILGEGAFVDDLRVLHPVSNDSGAREEGVTAYVAETIFGLLAAILLILILVDAFVLPRLPVGQQITREEE